MSVIQLRTKNIVTKRMLLHFCYTKTFLYCILAAYTGRVSFYCGIRLTDTGYNSACWCLTLYTIWNILYIERTRLFSQLLISTTLEKCVRKHHLRLFILVFCLLAALYPLATSTILTYCTVRPAFVVSNNTIRHYTLYATTIWHMQLVNNETMIHFSCAE